MLLDDTGQSLALRVRSACGAAGRGVHQLASTVDGIGGGLLRGCHDRSLLWLVGIGSVGEGENFSPLGVGPFWTPISSGYVSAKDC